MIPDVFYVLRHGCISYCDNGNEIPFFFFFFIRLSFQCSYHQLKYTFLFVHCDLWLLIWRIAIFFISLHFRVLHFKVRIHIFLYIDDRTQIITHRQKHVQSRVCKKKVAFHIHCTVFY